MSLNLNHLNLRAHGANPEKLYAALGLAMPGKIIDFSTNASVLPWPPLPEVDLPSLASHYPDDECLELRRLAAGREGVSINNILFTNGSNEALYLLASLFGETGTARAAVLQPAYPEYAAAFRSCQVNIENIFDLSESEIETGNFNVIILSNPCNPTGEYIPAQKLLSLIDKNPDRLFIIDEAYTDFLLNEEERGERITRGLRYNLIVLRSLTKFWHLSGLRIGYVIGPESWIERMKRRQPTWSVNAVAQALGLAFMKDGKFAQDSRAFYRAETPRFIRAVRDAGFYVRPSAVHFFLIGTEQAGGDEKMIPELLKRGLVVRHTRNFPGLDGRFIRVATHLPGENDQLVSALKNL